jgi:hypothetical protein
LKLLFRLNSSKRSSLRTTVPMSLVKQWNLKPGDKLDWVIKICDRELVAVIKKKSLIIFALNQ